MAAHEGPNFREMGEALVDRILELPVDVQLGIARTVVPRALASLDEGEREGFLRDLRREIDEQARGERSYDLRPGYSHDHPHHTR